MILRVKWIFDFEKLTLRSFFSWMNSSFFFFFMSWRFGMQDFEEFLLSRPWVSLVMIAEFSLFYPFFLTSPKIILWQGEWNVCFQWSWIDCRVLPRLNCIIWIIRSRMNKQRDMLFCFTTVMSLNFLSTSLGGGFKHFLFSPLFREDSHID